jgi:sugar phosphate isomerase/epimerase
MHPRLTILSRFAAPGVSLAEELGQLAGAGAERAGLNARRLGGDPAAAVSHAGIDVTHLGTGGLLAADLGQAVDAAVAVGAPIVYGPTGGALGLEWDDAAAAFAVAIAPHVAYATERGVALLIEPTISLFADISILHTLRDAVELAERTGVGVCVDVHHCWTERGLRDAIGAAAPRIGLVQISDWIPGVRHHLRAVPGDGAIPLERILGWILEAGYTGLFDLEVHPEPDVPAGDTIARALDRGARLLERFGA